MKHELLEYFLNQCKKNDIRIVPGHHPDFKNKSEIDKWINIMLSMFKDYCE